MKYTKGMPAAAMHVIEDEPREDTRAELCGKIRAPRNVIILLYLPSWWCHLLLTSRLADVCLRVRHDRNCSVQYLKAFLNLFVRDD